MKNKTSNVQLNFKFLKIINKQVKVSHTKLLIEIGKKSPILH